MITYCRHLSTSTRGGCEHSGQLKLCMSNDTLTIFSWDRVTESRVRVSPRLCVFEMLWCPH